MGTEKKKSEAKEVNIHAGHRQRMREKFFQQGIDVFEDHEILEMLLLNQGKILSKNLLIEKIWGYDNEAEYNNIEVYVSFIRRKLSAVNSSTEIKSIRGVGYTLGVKND